MEAKEEVSEVLEKRSAECLIGMSIPLALIAVSPMVLSTSC
jgi:hypothetical protein